MKNPSDWILNEIGWQMSRSKSHFIAMMNEQDRTFRSHFVVNEVAPTMEYGCDEMDEKMRVENENTKRMIRKENWKHNTSLKFLSS